MNLISWKGRFCTALRGCSLGHPLFSSHWKGNIQILTIWLLYAMRHFHKTIYGIFCKIRSVPSCKQTHIHTSVRKNQQEQVLEDLHYGNAFLFVGIGCFQSWRNMKSCKKSFDRFWNLLIILSCLCYTFIHSMSLRKYDCFWTTQLYQNLMVSCYFFASYYWIFKVRRHLFKCEVWVIKLRMRFYSILVVDLYIVCYNKL